MKRDYKHLAEELKRFIETHSYLYGLEVKLTERESAEDENSEPEPNGIDLICGYSLTRPEDIAQFVTYHRLCSYIIVDYAQEDGLYRNRLVWHIV